MQKDIREMMKDYKDDNITLSKHHEDNFKGLLMREMHPKKTKNKTYKWLSIAVSIVLFVSLGIKFYPTKTIEKDPEIRSNEITLGNISPEFQTIETYYQNSIKLEISQLDLSEEYKDFVDEYLLKIAELTKEYKLLTKELNTNGVNDVTIDALIRNLQLRLQLLKRLKEQLKQLKNLKPKQNETQII